MVVTERSEDREEVRGKGVEGKENEVGEEVDDGEYKDVKEEDGENEEEKMKKEMTYIEKWENVFWGGYWRS